MLCQFLKCSVPLQEEQKLLGCAEERTDEPGHVDLLVDEPSDVKAVLEGFGCLGLQLQVLVLATNSFHV